MAGCKGGEVTACMYICPHDLMKLDTERMKAINQEPDLCWECYFCVKIYPNNAIEMLGYADVMPMGATPKPVRDPKVYVFKARAVVCACDVLIVGGRMRWARAGFCGAAMPSVLASIITG